MWRLTAGETPEALAIAILVAGCLGPGASAGIAQPPAPAPPSAAPSPVSPRARLAQLRAAPGNLPEGVFTSIEYTLDVAERIQGRYAPQAKLHRTRALEYLAQVETGKDPFATAAGQILMRGYRSPISKTIQGYGIYLPPNYDPERAYPLLIMMHGGSANGNLFLGVVLGNNMNWKTYREHLWDAYKPRWKPDWIVVSPDGFGQIMWRWMGEQDVFDVLADVEKHHRVDPDRIVLGGLSNGGVGAYNIGMRHAWRFAAVTAIAGAPSWVQYAGGRADPLQASSLLPLSGMSLAENAFNTDFRYYHGRTDTGPMKPRFVEAFGQHIRDLNVPFKEKWYDAGHDLLYLVHRHGRIYEELEPLRRNPRPKEVRLATGDYRAARQHWLEVTRLASPPQLARLRGSVEEGRLRIETDHATQAFAIHVDDVPFEKPRVAIEVDGKQVFEGERRSLGDRFHLIRRPDGFAPGFPDAAVLDKRPGRSGPLTDSYYGATVHVYGTQKASDERALRRAAERGARGWPLWLWGFSQEVVADREVTDTLLANHHVVLYATPGANSVFERIRDRLPIQIDRDGVRLGTQTFRSPGVGTRFIYPNPLAPERYVTIQAAPSAEAVQAGHRLPDFLPDYVVYDRASTHSRPRLLFPPRKGPPALGYFDRYWRLPRPAADAGGDDSTRPPGDAGKPSPGRVPREAGALGIVPAPAPPKAPVRFTASAQTQAGRAARRIAQRMRGLENFRAKAPFATWNQRRDTLWSIEPNKKCLAQLARKGVRALPHRGTLATPVPTPVEVRGRVGGIWFRNTHEERTLLMSCEMARRLPDIAKVVKRHGVVGIDIMSAYRPKPFASYHTLGLGLDLLRFWTRRGVLSVLEHFEETPTTPTCEGKTPDGWQARALLNIACGLYRSGRFATVLTPNYNEGHRDHFHLDARPQDPRTFLR
ncbi:MAG: extensin family protein [Myxococcales bacterium]|nr:extensin family protein [Myxococcales bacterium]MDD9965509.1 extensin family protein [Myxococcales bacterium]